MGLPDTRHPKNFIDAHLNISAVCCVEFGRLEAETVLMVQSLRKFGGALSQIPVMAVVGRFGAPLRRATVDELERLNVQIMRAEPGSNPATWFNYGNKGAAVVTAEKHATTEQIMWLDSDMVFLGEPKSIVLNEGEGLAIAPIDTPPAVLLNDDTHVSYWDKVCSLEGVDFKDVPWVDFKGLRFKLNCNSGIFTWRRGSGFAEQYHSAFCKLLNSRVAQSTGEFFTVDQVILTPLSQKFKSKIIEEKDHAFSPSDFFQFGNAPDLTGVKLLHYSTAFRGPYREEIMRRILNANPDFYEWLAEHTFELGKSSKVSAGLALSLRVLRGFKYRAFERKLKR